MRLLVCGGRDFADRTFLYTILDRFRAKFGVTLLIEGDATGADRLAGEWAKQRGIDRVTAPANWIGRGKAAGSFRNQLMLDLFAPERVIAFEGGPGTRDMIRRATAAGITVSEVHRA